MPLISCLLTANQYVVGYVISAYSRDTANLDETLLCERTGRLSELRARVRVLQYLLRLSWI